jgi:hypothetical protein
MRVERSLERGEALRERRGGDHVPDPQPRRGRERARALKRCYSTAAGRTLMTRPLRPSLKSTVPAARA